MTARSAHALALFVVLAVLLVTSSVGSVGMGAAAADRSAIGAVAPTSAISASTAPGVNAGPAHAPGLVRSPAVERVERQIAGHAFAGRNAFLPTPFQAFGPPSSAGVAPIQQVGPAPMGLADLGLGATGAYSYNTTRFQGTISLSSYRTYSPGYPAFDEGPDWSAIQLNTVGVNISFPGAHNGTFWFQNVVHVNGSVLQLEDNIWNFSNTKLLIPASTIHSGNGTIQTGEFYYDYGPKFAAAFPLSLTLTNALANVTGRPTAYFNYSIDAGGTYHNGSYDAVAFNGVAINASPAQFRVSGYAYNPAGSEYDAELETGGNGGGTNAVVVAAAGNVTLDRWNASSAAYQPVRSAYDHGVDSAETATGIAAHYLGTTEYLTQGPSLLYGLWKTVGTSTSASAAPGWINVALTVSPAYALSFATNQSAFALPLPRANLTYAPASVSGTVVAELPPPPGGNGYVFAAWANGYANASVVVTDNTSGSASLALSPSAGTLNAPVYLVGDGQVAAYGTAGVTGTGYSASLRTLWINASSDALAAPFLRINDVGYPTFVLLAVADANLTVDVNRFVQAATTFQYTYWNSVTLALASISLPGWTQYYGFFGGRGAFTVTNTTLTGNSTYFLKGVYSPAAIQFVGTNDSRAGYLAVAQYSYGVDLIGASNVTVRSVTSLTGSSGVSATNATYLTVIGLTSSGSPAFASTGVFAFGGGHFALSSLTVSNQSQELNLTNVHGITITSLNVSLSGLAGYFEDTSQVTVSGVSIVTSGAGLEFNNSSTISESNVAVNTEGYAGWIDFSSGITINQISVIASDAGGIDFTNDSSVSVAHGSAVGDVAFADIASIVQSFTNCSGGTFSHISSDVQSFGVAAMRSTSLTFTDISAVTNSIGAWVVNSSWVNATGVNASVNSTGVSWNGGSHGTISTGVVGRNSTGVALSNTSFVSVRQLTAVEPAAGAPYYTSTLLGYLLPVAPVSLFHTANMTVADISAVGFPFGVWANYTNHSTIDRVTAWNGIYGVQLNSSGNDTIAWVFAQGNTFGAVLNNTSDSRVTNSTFEDSATYGMWIHNSTYLHVDRCNFVGNNNSSTSGSFSPLHLQAWVNNSSAIYFNATNFGPGNYWSDHPGSGTYVLHVANASEGQVQDSSPSTVFLTNWLKFVAVNLPALTLWGFAPSGSTLALVNYTTTAGLVYIPSWSLPNETLQYSVHPTSGYVPAPPSGGIAYAGANTTVTIQFGLVVTFVATGLPTGTLWRVQFNGTIGNAASVGGTATITFSVPNGRYSYQLTAVPNYGQSSAPGTGTVIVAGTNVTLTFAYKAAVVSPPPPLPYLYIGIGAGALAAVVALLLVVRIRRRRAAQWRPPPQRPA